MHQPSESDETNNVALEDASRKIVATYRYRLRVFARFSLAEFTALLRLKRGPPTLSTE
jgi:hypothetical protein